MEGCVVGVDVGGTFTDLVAWCGGLREVKVLTNPRAPEESVLRAVEEAGIDLSSVSYFIHATTLGTNMLFGQVGLEKPEAVLVTNRGFRDVLEIGRQNRPRIYDPYFTRPKPLVPRSRRYGVAGRVSADGSIVEPLDRRMVEEIARRHCGPRTVFVVSMLHCYRNPVLEEEAAGIIRRVCRDSIVVTSCGIDPAPGEYERTSTAVVNALLKPLFSSYIRRLERGLRERGFRGVLLVMQSSGGVAEVGVVEEKPALFIESGPAAGAIATAYLARMRGDDLVIGFDMGGTTAKAVLVAGGEPSMTGFFEVGGETHMGRLVRGSGYPVRAPHIDLVEVSAGGGTIAWVDRGGALRVGPLSAGADPGPACYGRGGVEPTVTDAHAVLGRLPEYLAGGRVRVRRDLAVEAYRRLGERLGLDPVDAAVEALRLAIELMARAVRIVTVERGYDPSTAILYAYGGAGPLHAVELAETIGVRRILIPPHPGVFSALGLLLADARMDHYRPVYRPVSEVSGEELGRLAESFEGEVYLELGYRGQAGRIEVPWTGSLEGVVEEFEEEYRRRYGFLPPEPRPPIILHRIHLVEKHPLPKPWLSAPRAAPGGPRGVAEAYMLGHGWVRASVYDRYSLPAGYTAEGPAIILEEDSTTVIPPGYRFRVEEDASILVEA